VLRDNVSMELNSKSGTKVNMKIFFALFFLI
jgi:hypothetical protein